MTVEKDPVDTIADADLVRASADTEMTVLPRGTGNPGAGQRREKNGLRETGQRTGLARRGLAGIEVIGTGMIAAADAFLHQLRFNQIIQYQAGLRNGNKFCDQENTQDIPGAAISEQAQSLGFRLSPHISLMQ